MGHAELQTRYYTAAEYFALEEQSEVRHEYFDGELFAMAGASKAHNRIANNFYRLSFDTLQSTGCQLFTSDVRLAVEENRHYTYPDVVVSCDPADQHDDYLIRHPVLIVEVLSPSTEAYDRAEKFLQYQKLASLRHYVLVHQQKWFVEWFRRNELGEWVVQQLNGADDVLELPDLNLRFPLAGLYAGTGVAPMRVTPPGIERVA